jgi:hypothetical protein
MKTLYEVAAHPSGWDSYSNYVGETPSKELLVVMTRTRDSDNITESNWRVSLTRLGGESENVVIERFGHWACGWWEALCVKDGSDKQKDGQEIFDQILGYPILDEDDYSKIETEDADRTWKDCFTYKSRIQHLRDHADTKVDFRSWSDLLQCVRGNYAPYGNSGYEGII